MFIELNTLAGTVRLLTEENPDIEPLVLVQWPDEYIQGVRAGIYAQESKAEMVRVLRAAAIGIDDYLRNVHLAGDVGAMMELT